MTLAPHVHIDPEGYEAAATVVGAGVATTLFRARWALVDALSSCAAMAGSDEAGTTWALSYDQAAQDVVDVLADVVNACYRFAALLQQTGFNYGLYVSTIESQDDGRSRMPSLPRAAGWMTDRGIGRMSGASTRSALRIKGVSRAGAMRNSVARVPHVDNTERHATLVYY